jgi:hypothetical protein
MLGDALDLGRVALAEEVQHHDGVGIDGGVAEDRPAPVAILRMLHPQERLLRALDRIAQEFRELWGSGTATVLGPCAIGPVRGLAVAKALSQPASHDVLDHGTR